VGKLIVASVLITCNAQAQQYDSLAKKYKKEDAVVTNSTEHLVISNEDGELVANSYMTHDKLFITNLSRGCIMWIICLRAIIMSWRIYRLR
jgi:hypothetical protein